MGASLETIASEALGLPEDQRLKLAYQMLASVKPEAGADEGWDKEIRDRIERFDAEQSNLTR